MTWNLTMAFWATCKIGQPIQPIWQKIFALSWSALKKPLWQLNFSHLSAILSSSRREKCFQMLERLFVASHHSRNIPYLWTKIIQRYCQIKIGLFFENCVALENFTNSRNFIFWNISRGTLICLIWFINTNP